MQAILKLYNLNNMKKIDNKKMLKEYRELINKNYGVQIKNISYGNFLDLKKFIMEFEIIEENIQLYPLILNLDWVELKLKKELIRNAQEIERTLRKNVFDLLNFDYLEDIIENEEELKEIANDLIKKSDCKTNRFVEFLEKLIKVDISKYSNSYVNISDCGEDF